MKLEKGHKYVDKYIIENLLLDFKKTNIKKLRVGLDKNLFTMGKLNRFINFQKNIKECLWIGINLI